MSNTKDNENNNEEPQARRPEARSQQPQPNLPTSIMGPGGDYEPPASTPGGSSGGSTGGGG